MIAKLDKRALALGRIADAAHDSRDKQVLVGQGAAFATDGYVMVAVETQGEKSAEWRSLSIEAAKAGEKAVKTTAKAAKDGTDHLDVDLEQLPVAQVPRLVAPGDVVPTFTFWVDWRKVDRAVQVLAAGLPTDKPIRLQIAVIDTPVLGEEGATVLKLDVLGRPGARAYVAGLAKR